MTLTRTAYPTTELPTNTTIIDQDKIKEAGAQNVAEVLEKEAGVHIAKIAGRGSLESISLRGFSSKNVLVLIDGRPLRNAYTGTIDLSQISVDAIDRIEVVRGPSSALYGQNAVGGVVHIITKRGTAAVPKVSFTAQTGSYNTEIYRVQAAGKAGPVDSLISGSRNYSSGFRDNSDFANYSTQATFGLDGQAWGRTEIQGAFVQSQVGTPGSLPIPPVAYDGSLEKAASAPTDRQFDRDRSARLEHSLPLGNDSKLIARLFYNDHDQTFQTAFPFFSRAIDQKAEIQAQLPAGFIVGGEFETARFRSSSSLSNPRFTTDIWSGYAQNTTPWGDRLMTILGLRGDNDSNYGGSVNPRATVIYKANSWLKLSGNGGRAFRAPTFADLFGPPPNADIRPETTWSGDVGAEVKPTEDILAKITLFQTFTNDRIVASPPSFQAQNLSKAFTQGVEFDYDQTLVGPLRHSLAYTFTEARGKLTGDYFDLPLTPRHRAVYALEAAPPQGFRVKSSWRYIGLNYFAATDGSGRTVLPETWLWDIRLAHRKHSGEVFFLVENLLNRRYALNANPPAAPSFFSPAGTPPSWYPQPGRTFSGGVSVYFW